MDGDVLAPVIEGKSDKAPIGCFGCIRGRDIKNVEEFLAVVEPGRGNNQTARSLAGLLLKDIFGGNGEKQVTQPNRAFGPFPGSVGTVVGHGRAHAFQPMGTNRSAVVAVDPVDSAHARFRAKVVKILNRSCPAPPVTRRGPKRSHAWARSWRDSPRSAPKLTVPSRPRRRSIQVAARAWARQRASHGT